MRNLKKLKIIALVTVFSLATTIISCASLSKEEYEKKVTGIVKNAREKVGKTQSEMKSPEKMSVKEQKKAIQKFSSIFKETSDELDKITPPADYKKGHDYLKKNYELGEKYMKLTSEAIDQDAKGKNTQKIEDELMKVEKELKTVQNNIGKELPFLEEFLNKQ